MGSSLLLSAFRALTGGLAVMAMLVFGIGRDPGPELRFGAGEALRMVSARTAPPGERLDTPVVARRSGEKAALLGSLAMGDEAGGTAWVDDQRWILAAWTIDKGCPPVHLSGFEVEAEAGRSILVPVMSHALPRPCLSIAHYKTFVVAVDSSSVEGDVHLRPEPMWGEP